MDHYYVFWKKAAKHGRRVVAKAQPEDVKSASQLNSWLLSLGRITGSKYTSVMANSEREAVGLGISAIQHG